MPKTCLIIANPISGMGLGRRTIRRLAAGLRGLGYDVELCSTTGAGTALRAARKAEPDDVSLILSVGGDGTLNEVVNGLGDKRIPVAVFPTGTGNVLAKECGVRRSVRGACEMIRRGRTRQLDVGVVNGRRFVLFASAGFDAAVVEAVSLRRVGGSSLLGYVWPMAATLITYRLPEINVTVDGCSAGQATTVLVTNVRSYGGPFRFVDGADPADGLLDVCLMRGRRRRDVVRYMWGAVRGRVLRYEDTTHLRGLVVELEAAEPVPVQADGDFICRTPARIELLAAHLSVLVP